MAKMMTSKNNLGKYLSNSRIGSWLSYITTKIRTDTDKIQIIKIGEKYFKVKKLG